MKTAVLSLLVGWFVAGCEVYDEPPVRHHRTVVVGHRDYDDRYYNDQPRYYGRRVYRDDRAYYPPTRERVIVY